jgi:TPR repeat protein
MKALAGLAERLVADDEIMAKYRRVAGLPGVRDLWAEWQREIAAFWAWGREEDRQRQARFAARCAEARPAALKGDAKAQRIVGYCCQLGLGAPKDFKQALDWYRRSAAGGDDAAQNNLGTMFRKGEGVAQDRREAAKWFRMSAEQGNPIAQFNLGSLYEDGEGLPKDRVEAGAWFLLALGQGYGPASGRFAALALSGSDAAEARRRARRRRRP